jgi:transcriptional regulator with XRE-family HTH domain
MNDMGQRLELLRTTLGYKSLQSFAQAINIPKSSYWHYEKGERQSDTSRLLPILKKFGVNKKWLFEGEGEMFTKEEQTELLLETPIKEDQYTLSSKELDLLFSLGDLNKAKREKVIRDFKSYLEIQKMIKHEAQ